ncbi:MAG: alanine racemase [Kiloniellales bacterium]
MPPIEDAGGGAGAVLSIDLAAIVANYRLLCRRLGGVECATVVKADAYGLGMHRVAPALARAGCRQFFVARLDEGVALRRLMPEAAIGVFDGALPGTEPVYREHHLMPVLNHLGQVDAWAALAARRRRPLPAILHVDTGMTRLGLEPAEVDRLAEDPGRLAGIELSYVMSHLACADEPGHEMNARQLATFTQARRRLAQAPASLANSSGIFLGPDYHFDLARPGAALYGVAPQPGTPNPMAQVINLKGKILQVRNVDSPMTVGYGATHRVTRAGRLATVAVGYADGYLRSLSNRAHAFLGDVRVPVVGRVSMDLITLDVTAAPPRAARPGQWVDLLGPRHGVDALAAEAGTIGYEILTALGHRYHRVYVETPGKHRASVHNGR